MKSKIIVAPLSALGELSLSEGIVINKFKLYEVYYEEE